MPTKENGPSLYVRGMARVLKQCLTHTAFTISGCMYKRLDVFASTGMLYSLLKLDYWGSLVYADQVF